jgi:hypothetical protein
VTCELLQEQYIWDGTHGPSGAVEVMFLVTASLPRAEHVNGTGKPRRSAASLFQPGPEKQRGWRFAVLSLLLHASGTRPARRFGLGLGSQSAAVLLASKLLCVCLTYGYQYVAYTRLEVQRHAP